MIGVDEVLKLPLVLVLSLVLHRLVRIQDVITVERRFDKAITRRDLSALRAWECCLVYSRKSFFLIWATIVVLELLSSLIELLQEREILARSGLVTL